MLTCLDNLHKLRNSKLLCEMHAGAGGGGGGGDRVSRTKKRIFTSNGQTFGVTKTGCIFICPVCIFVFIKHGKDINILK